VELVCSLSVDHPYPFLERPEVVALIPPARRLLDVGCGRGGFGFALRRGSRRVDELWGIEPHPEAAEEAKTHFDHVITGMYPDDLPAEERFDVVVFNDVLEHMPDPWGALESTRGILTPEGRVVASIPNIRYWPILWDLVVRGRWTYTDTGTLDRTHLRFFTRGSALALFRDAGYDVERVERGYRLEQHGGRFNRRFLLLPSELRTLQFLIVARAAR